MLSEILQYYLFGFVILGVFAIGPRTDVKISDEKISDALVVVMLLAWPLLLVLSIVDIVLRLFSTESNQKEESDEN